MLRKTLGVRVGLWPSVAVAAILLSAPPQAGAASDAGAADRIGLGYRLYAGGLHALTFDAAVDVGGSAYEVDFTARTDGWIGKLFDLVLTANAHGRRTESGLRPQLFRTANRWQGNDERWVRLTYGDPDTPLAEAEPPPSEDDREAVPEAMRRGTVDPITAVFELLGAGGGESCQGRAAVFDGRRRYDLEARRVGEGGLRATRYNIYSGPALECRLVFREIQGFWKKTHLQGRYPEEIRVWLAEMGADKVPVPVRMSAKTRFSAVLVHLTRLDLPGAETVMLDD